MKKATLVVSDYLTNNLIFDETGIHRDNIFDRFIKLKQIFLGRGFDLSTQDINLIEESEFILYASNMPDLLPKESQISSSYLILTESNFIRPDNYEIEKHAFFNKIFTWSDELIDNKKYFKLNYAHLFPDKIKVNLKHKKKLCILISANKNAPFSPNNDLYSERRNTIRWFEKYHSEDFDLYGMGWDCYLFTGPIFFRIFNRFPFLSKLYQKLIKQEFPSYMGMVDNKNDTMERYKFSICYENAKDITGYITEKIFDSFFAGCVPIYWGADNILDYIPKNCFIDKRDFAFHDDLYTFINTMSDEHYLEYQNNIQKYLHSPQAIQFTSEGFINTLANNILGDIDDHN